MKSEPGTSHTPIDDDQRLDLINQYHWDNEYPTYDCVKHPSRMWEWDGYCWVCVGCVFDDPMEAE